MNANDTSNVSSSSSSSSTNPTSLGEVLGRIEAYYNLNNNSEDDTRVSHEADETPSPSTTPHMEPPLKDAKHDVTKDDTPPSKRTLSRRSQRGQRKMENLPAQKREAHYLSFAVDLLRIIDDNDNDNEHGLSDQ